MSRDAGITPRTAFTDLPEFLSPEQFWAYLGISRSTVYDLLRREAIPHVKLGRCIRIHKSVLLTAFTGVQ